MEESGKSSRGFRKKPSNCQRNNRISNLQTSSKWEVCLTSTAFNESTDSPTFSNFTIKKNRNPFVVKVNQLTTKFKSVFDSHYQMHIRLAYKLVAMIYLKVALKTPFYILVFITSHGTKRCIKRKWSNFWCRRMLCCNGSDSWWL